MRVATQDNCPPVVFLKDSFNPEKFATHLEALEAQIPGSDASEEDWNAYIQELDGLLREEILDRNRGILAITQKEADSLADYFYLNKLLLDCKDAAIRVSKGAWEEIEERLLTPP